MIWKSLFLTLLAAVIQILIFPKFGLFPLAWIMLVPLLAAVESRGALASFLFAGLFGLVMALGITYWLYISVVDYFGLSPFAGLAFIVGACLFYAAIYCGLFGFLLSYLLLKERADWQWKVAGTALILAGTVAVAV